ncbi:MAG: hypothetical protein ABEK29_06925, partial [Bradymonadaceae bacterium]
PPPSYADGTTDYRITEKAGPLHVVRQPSPWSLTAGYAERVKDILTGLRPAHRTRSIMRPERTDGEIDLATTPQKVRRWAGDHPVQATAGGLAVGAALYGLGKRLRD